MSEWKETKIIDIADFNINSIDKNFKFNTIEYIDTSSVEQGQLINVQKINLKEAPSRAKRRIQENDILISSVRPNLKHYYFVKQCRENTVVSTGFVVITPQKIVHPYFLYCLLTTNEYTQYLTQIANNHTSTYPSFNPDIIANSVLPIPEFKEQKQIADILSCLDNKIDNLRRQNETLEKIAQTLFKHWFIDFEFPNDDGKPYKSSGGAMVASELGDIPAGWRVITLKECLQHLIDNRGKTPKFFSSGIPALSAKFIKGGTLVNQENFNYISLDLFASSEKLQPGDIIMTSEAPLGELYYISKNTNYYPAQRVFALRANQKVVLSAYLNYWLGSSLGQFLINRRATGSTVQGIKQTELYQCEVLLPQRELMENFSHCFNKLLYKKELNEKQIQTLTKTRDTLLPKLMSGQIRVKEVESIIEEVK